MAGLIAPAVAAGRTPARGWATPAGPAPLPEGWWALQGEAVLSALGSGPEGLTEAEAARRRASDLVLTAIDRGRRAFASTMAYVRLALSASFGNMLSLAAASVVLPFLP